MVPCTKGKNHNDHDGKYISAMIRVENVDDNGKRSEYMAGPFARTVPSSSSVQSTHVSNPVTHHMGFPWRATSSYYRAISYWSYEDTAATQDLGLSGNPYNERTFFHWDGCYFGSIHIGDIQIGYVGSGEESNTISKATTECLVKLGEGKVNLGQFIAESRKTAQTLASTGSDLLKLLLHVKRGNLSALPRDYGVLVDHLGNNWLRWQYGWKPLCKDLYEIHQQLTRGLNKPHIFSVRKSASSSLSGKWTQLGLACSGTTKFTANVCITAALTDEFLAKANNYGLVNPLSLGWELIPYSFVVDWFMPIGNTLASLSAPAGLRFVDGSAGIAREGFVEVDSPWCGRARNDMIIFSRNKLYNFPPTPLPYANPRPDRKSVV